MGSWLRSYLLGVPRMAARSWLSAPTRMPSPPCLIVRMTAALQAAVIARIFPNRRMRDSEGAEGEEDEDDKVGSGDGPSMRSMELWIE